MLGAALADGDERLGALEGPVDPLLVAPVTEVGASEAEERRDRAAEPALELDVLFSVLLAVGASPPARLGTAGTAHELLLPVHPRRPRRLPGSSVRVVLLLLDSAARGCPSEVWPGALPAQVEVVPLHSSSNQRLLILRRTPPRRRLRILRRSATRAPALRREDASTLLRAGACCCGALAARWVFLLVESFSAVAFDRRGLHLLQKSAHLTHGPVEARMIHVALTQRTVGKRE
mmetsp:Transcript_50860/g.120373  ORF Transcript_50860/g.120373 Transcript_50860/m.120373 type:complete len:233 (+) Transcript_50860:154-852(+)